MRPRLQGPKIRDDFLSLPLGSSDVILGIQWLEKLGPMTTNWKTQHMQFVWNNEQIVLLGDVSLRRARVSLKAILTEIHMEEGGVLVECKG